MSCSSGPGRGLHGRSGKPAPVDEGGRAMKAYALLLVPPPTTRERADKKLAATAVANGVPVGYQARLSWAGRAPAQVGAAGGGRPGGARDAPRARGGSGACRCLSCGAGGRGLRWVARRVARRVRAAGGGGGGAADVQEATPGAVHLLYHGWLLGGGRRHEQAVRHVGGDERGHSARRHHGAVNGVRRQRVGGAAVRQHMCWRMAAAGRGVVWRVNYVLPYTHAHALNLITLHPRTNLCVILYACTHTHTHKLT